MPYLGHKGKLFTIKNNLDVHVIWKLNDFLSLSEEDGDYCYSPYFSFGGSDWCFRIYPNGSSIRGSREYVDLCLCKESVGPPIKLQISLWLKTVKGTKDHEVHASVYFKYWSDCQDFPRIIARSQLRTLQSKFLPCGVLTIVCTIKVAKPTNSKSDVTTAGCSYCGKIVSSEDIATHQKKCLDRPIKCPDCSDVVLLQNWFNHECQVKRLEEEVYEQPATAVCSNHTSKVSESDASEDSCLIKPDVTGTNKSEEVYEQSATAVSSNGTLKVSESDESEDSCLIKPDVTGTNKSEKVNEQPTAPYSKVDALKVSESSEKEDSCSVSPDTTGTKELAESYKVPFIVLPEEGDLVTAIHDLFKDGKGVDVTFELETQTGKTRFSAHKIILAVRSAHFGDIFYGQGRNKGHQVVPLKGIDPNAFEKMIRYFYGFETYMETTEDACALLNIAYKFKVLSLLNLCHTYFKNTKIEPGNVFSVLEISDKLDDENLSDICYKILQEKTEEIIAACTLSDVSPTMVCTILDLSKLSLSSESELIQWIFKWAKAKTGDKNSTCENSRQYLEKFLQKMNFLSLTTEEFASLCKEYPDFFTSDEIASIFLNITFPESRQMPTWYDKALKCRVYTRKNE